MILQLAGVGVTDQETLTALQRTMHNLAVSIQAAERTNQMDAAMQLRGQLRGVRDQVAMLVQKLKGEEMPSGAMMALSSISDDLRSIGEQVPAVLKSTSTGLIAIALLYGLFLLGPMLKKGVGTKSW